MNCSPEFKPTHILGLSKLNLNRKRNRIKYLKIMEKSLTINGTTTTISLQIEIKLNLIQTLTKIILTLKIIKMVIVKVINQIIDTTVRIITATIKSDLQIIITINQTNSLMTRLSQLKQQSKKCLNNFGNREQSSTMVGA